MLAHHERLDGKGYPQGLKDDEIPYLSKVISVAEAYDFMTRVGSSKEPLSVKAAIKELKSNAGTQFDEKIIKYLLKKFLKKSGIRQYFKF